ncbi:MAG: metallophosphoesterase [Thermoanaerobaculia bacterium]|nr:metallophosphoesterase [Thermoanaerobaculia bacterium]
MRLGVVSDTHDHLGNVRRIVEIFNGAGVDAVVHTGDVTTPSTLALFARLGVPFHGVLGNNDRDVAGLLETARREGFEIAPATLVLEIGGRRVVAIHDPSEATPARVGDADVLLHGHTHRQTLERRDGRLVFNPGECAGWLAGRNAVGVVDTRTLRAEVLRF